MGLCGAIAHAVNRRRLEFGIRLALGAARLLAHALETGQGFDPLAFGVAVVAIAAVVVPARQAANVEPATMLRQE
jgi:hypothetical protein